MKFNFQNKTVKVGDTVSWRDCWGTSAPRDAIVKRMEITDQPRSKYGNGPVDEVSEDLVKENRVIFDLDNGKWAYASQIDIKD